MEQQARTQAEEPQAAGPAGRLRAYLRALSPAAQDLLSREFERALARGDDAAVAAFVLKELRALAPPPSPPPQPAARTEPEPRDLLALAFAPLKGFLIDSKQSRPGGISLALKRMAWTWVTRDGLREEVAAFAADLDRAADDPAATTAIVHAFQRLLADAFTKASSSPDAIESQRSLFRLGGSELLETVAAIGAVLLHRDQLEAFSVRLPTIIRAFGESQINSVSGLLNQYPELRAPTVLPFTLALVMQRLASPWQIVRLAIRAAGSDEEARVAANPFGVAVQMVLHDLSSAAGQLHDEVRRGLFAESAHHLKTLHDGIRDLRSEIELRSDSHWGRQLAAIRVDISRSLKNDIDSAPGRVRRLLRQRLDRDIAPTSRLDPADIDETAGLIGLVTACKPYASELAISEVTQRALTEIQHHVETSTEGLVESLRVSDARTRPFRQQQTEVAIRFCEMIFGHDYAELMRRAAGNALSAARKPARANG